MPHPQNAPDSNEQRIADLVLASHILENERVLDSFVHVSVRSADNPRRYFISRSLAPAPRVRFLM